MGDVLEPLKTRDLSPEGCTIPAPKGLLGLRMSKVGSGDLGSILLNLGSLA